MQVARVVSLAMRAGLHAKRGEEGLVVLRSIAWRGLMKVSCQNEPGI